jgi:hypothetical protein
MTHPFEKEPFQVLPVALEDQQGAVLVEAEEARHSLPILAGDAELVHLPWAQIGPELHGKVQVCRPLVGEGRFSGLRSGLPGSELRDFLKMPGSRVIAFRIRGEPSDAKGN